MNKCIYLTEASENLKYNSEEHIIPAGLGGMQKLPKGYVSDKINNMFSKYELKAMRNSLLTGNRMKHGPGKRGNQNVKKQRNHKIQLLKDESSEDNHFLLGYVFSGKSYLLPQMSCVFDFVYNSMSVNYIVDNYEVENYNEHFLELRKKLNEFLFDKKRSFTFIKDEFQELDNNVNIGFYKGKWYLSSNIFLLDINAIADKIISYSFNNVSLSKKSLKKQAVKEIGKIEFRHRQPIDITDNSFGFIFTKTAFNALAYLKGQEFALLNIFDDLRNDIIECNDMTPYIISNKIHDEIFTQHIDKVPDNAHCVYIVSDGNVIYAYVTLYNEWHAHIILTDKYSGDSFVVGFVCDWKIKREYTIK